MITLEKIKELATKYQMPIIENVAREYFQHLFLSHFYEISGSEKILFKGGTALRIIYGSPRFSEDLDFSSFDIESHTFKNFIEDRFQDTLAFIEQAGINVELGPKSGLTPWGYYGDASFTLHGLKVNVPINVSQRDKRPIKGEIEAAVNDYIPTYNLWHLPKNILVEEKIDALLERGKPRDFYDLYFMFRKGLIELKQKEKLPRAKKLIEQTEIDFKSELETFLPRNHHPIIRDLKARLLDELNRQLAVG